jgi:hypothetical protein
MPIVKMQKMKSGVCFVTIPTKFVKSLKMKKGMSCICEVRNWKNDKRLIYYPI